MKRNSIKFQDFSRIVKYAHFSILLLCTTVIIIIAGKSDLQPSTTIVNQLPAHLVSTQIRTIGLNCFKFIMELIVPGTKIV